ncbi:hypothetical protein V8C86DRAFT_2463233 [Haematococcus lacustris]
MSTKAKGSKGGLKWDEANLDENEKIKSELPVVKITEPKTPYHAPLDGDEASLEPMLLDGVPAGAAHDHADLTQRKLVAKETLAASRKKIEEELKAEGGGGQ